MSITVLFTPTRCVMGAGSFDTDFRYIRTSAGGGTFPLPQNDTVRVAADTRYVMSRWTNGVASIEYRLGGGATGLGDATATLVII